MNNKAEIEAVLDQNRIDLDGYKIFVNVYDMAAALAVAQPYRNNNGDYSERVGYIDDLESIGITYQDLIEAVEATGGAINRSGWYACTPKIVKAVFGHKDVIRDLF